MGYSPAASHNFASPPVSVLIRKCFCSPAFESSHLYLPNRLLRVTNGQREPSEEQILILMKTTCFGELPVGTFFLFRGQRFKKLGTSLAGDSKRYRILFDRDTQVEILGKR